MSNWDGLTSKNCKENYFFLTITGLHLVQTYVLLSYKSSENWNVLVEKKIILKFQKLISCICFQLCNTQH